MNLANEKVHHRQFGDGIVTEQTISMVTVQFSEDFGEKRFLYPSAFESFLPLNSPTLRAKMEADRRQREQEVKQREEEERRELLERKKAAAKSRTTKRKAAPKPEC